MAKATKKSGMEISALGQLNMMRSFIETDQQTIDAIGQRLAVIHALLKDVTQQLEEWNADKGKEA